MIVTVKGQLDDESTYMLSRRLWALRSAKEAVKKVSLAGERAIKLKIPVDTGRARASWGHWTRGDIRKSGSGASPSDTVWKTEQDGLSQTQGSNVEYIVYLNDGTEKMPALGFVEAGFESMKRELDREIEFIMDAL